MVETSYNRSILFRREKHFPALFFFLLMFSRHLIVVLPYLASSLIPHPSSYPPGAAPKPGSCIYSWWWHILFMLMLDLPPACHGIFAIFAFPIVSPFGTGTALVLLIHWARAELRIGVSISFHAAG